MTNATLTANCSALVQNFERELENAHVEHNQVVLGKVEPRLGAGFLLWKKGGKVEDAYLDACRMIATCPSDELDHWKRVASILKKLRRSSRRKGGR